MTSRVDKFTGTTGVFAGKPETRHAMELEHTLCGWAYDVAHPEEPQMGDWVEDAKPTPINCEHCIEVVNFAITVPIEGRP